MLESFDDKKEFVRFGEVQGVQKVSSYFIISQLIQNRMKLFGHLYNQFFHAVQLNIKIVFVIDCNFELGLKMIAFDKNFRWLQKLILQYLLSKVNITPLHLEG